MAVSMRLMMVNSALPTMWGGGEMWFTEASQWFSERGHQVCVVGRPRSRFLDAVRGTGVDTIGFDFGGDYDPIAIAKAWSLQNTVRPDIVLVNFNKEAWLFGRGAKLLRRPVVARHGLTLFKDKLVHRLVYRWHMDRVIVNASSIREDYSRRGFDTSKVTVILNGVRETPRRDGELRDMLGVPPGTLLVGAAGRLNEQKRFDRFIRIADALHRRGLDARFALLGDGSELATLKAQAATTGLGDRLIFGGFCEGLAARAGDLDLFLLTSQNEGTPNVLLEVMARGVASLAFGVGAVPEVLTGPCATGLIDEGDESAMTEIAARLLQNRAEREELGSVQRAHVLGALGFDRSMERYEELLLGLMR